MTAPIPVTMPPEGPLRDAIQAALDAPPVRVRPLTGPDGAHYWLKRAERLTLRLRLQKGDSQKGFEADRQGMHALRDAGLPVVPIVAEGPDFFVTPDMGHSLRTLQEHGAVPEAERLAAFSAAGAALAALHQAGFCHGRPSIRDILWDGRTARFIDLERFRPGQSGARRFATDTMIFVHSIFAAEGMVEAELEAALMAYRAGAPDAAWLALKRKTRRLLWLVPLTAPFRWISPGSRDLHAVPKTLRYLSRLD